jgi:hypothetical protein
MGDLEHRVDYRGHCEGAELDGQVFERPLPTSVTRLARRNLGRGSNHESTNGVGDGETLLTKRFGQGKFAMGKHYA